MEISAVVYFVNKENGQWTHACVTSCGSVPGSENIFLSLTFCEQF